MRLRSTSANGIFTFSSLPALDVSETVKSFRFRRTIVGIPAAIRPSLDQPSVSAFVPLLLSPPSSHETQMGTNSVTMTLVRPVNRSNDFVLFFIDAVRYVERSRYSGTFKFISRTSYYWAFAISKPASLPLGTLAPTAVATPIRISPIMGIIKIRMPRRRSLSHISTPWEGDRRQKA
ncbi:hypothetical protein FVEG_16065 [Fusarium verticillioides 7600]|uniref:Uncharacterized protein n=1 Tax=Gibberella moniliformis (strain M3125 / FGSC 7600) TaxID=334819 RepID=W7MHN5_GIBM7|nr:hypothetical protein FVEG_16065 [Fusarium verticillioides 7600]EWG47055.1 hypothetical protein FVEG_16065 [Fusarium verticillioides 7600]